MHHRFFSAGGRKPTADAQLRIVRVYEAAKHSVKTISRATNGENVCECIQGAQDNGPFTALISPPGVSRQDYVMPLLYFLSYSSFLTIACSKEISETTRLIFTKFSGVVEHVGVDVQSGIGFRIGLGTLSLQPLLSVKSAEIGDTPSFL